MKTIKQTIAWLNQCLNYEVNRSCSRPTIFSSLTEALDTVSCFYLYGKRIKIFVKNNSNEVKGLT